MFTGLDKLSTYLPKRHIYISYIIYIHLYHRVHAGETAIQLLGGGTAAALAAGI